MGSKIYRMKKEQQKERPARPLAFWVLWLAYAGVTVASWERMVKAINDYYWLNLAGLFPGPVYIAITGGIWGMIGLAVVVWMASGRPGYRQAGFAAALFFAIFYWADRLLFSRSPGDSANIGFAILFTLFWLLYALLVLRPIRARKAERYVEVQQTEHSQSL